MPEVDEVGGVDTQPIVITQRKGEKPFPSVVCPHCGKAAEWQGKPHYGRRVFITYACVEDDGCGAVGSRPLRERNKVEEPSDVQE